MPAPVDCITNEIRRQLKKMDGSTVESVCQLIADKYHKNKFKRPLDLIEEGVKLARKLDKEKK